MYKMVPIGEFVRKVSVFFYDSCPFCLGLNSFVNAIFNKIVKAQLEIHLDLDVHVYTGKITLNEINQTVIATFTWVL